MDNVSTNSEIFDFEIYDSEFSELNTTMEYDEETGQINYTTQFDSLIISNVFLIFTMALLVGVKLGGMFLKR